MYNQEVVLHADVPRVLGKENVFVFGRVRPHFYDPAVPETCLYPSFHGASQGTEISDAKTALSVIKDVDVVFLSVRGGARRDAALREARNRDVPIVMLDYADHEANYGAKDIEKELCCGFRRGEHFDLYFKNDLPLGHRTDVIHPLAPVPVRPESYRFPSLERDIDIFFSGRLRKLYQADRAETIALLKDHFGGAFVLGHQTSGTFETPQAYCEKLSRSKMALCPSGRVWATQRHCEIGLAPSAALIAARPYVETVGPPLKDGVNAVLYDVEFRDGKYHLAGAAELREKIAYYLDRPVELQRVAQAWASDVRTGHTILARTTYLVETVERSL